MSENVLVTGGAGYIGSHVCKALYLAGYHPIVFDNLSTGHERLVKWGPLVNGDLLKQNEVDLAFEKYKPTSVIHLAAKAYVSESVKNPIKYFRENISGSVNLIEAFLRFGGINFVFSSSCATYGEPEISPINETVTQSPINPYGFTKLAVERLLKDLRVNNTFNFGILRYFNAVGADPDGEIGELHDPETHVVPLMIKAACESKEFVIFGSNYETKDGTAIRDYIHVSDLAAAHVASLNHVRSKGQNLICNLGTGQGISLLDLATEMKKIMPNFKYCFGPRRAGDPKSLVADNELSRLVLGMNYPQSQIQNILQTAINWDQITKGN